MQIKVQNMHVKHCFSDKKHEKVKISNNLFVYIKNFS